MIYIFGQRLKQLRIEKNLKQSEMANILETTVRNYQNYEYDQRHPDYKGLIELADFFNVSVDYLLGRTDNPEINK